MKYGSGTYFVFSFDYVKQDWSAGQHKGHFDLSNIKEEEQFLWNVFFDVLLCEISLLQFLSVFIFSTFEVFDISNHIYLKASIEYIEETYSL